MKADMIGIVEISDTASGYRVLDAMVKAAPVAIMRAGTVNPGKFLILVTGEVASLEYAMDAALNCGAEAVIDHLLLKNLDQAVITALDDPGDEQRPLGGEDLEALGIIETFSITAAVEAADRSVKAADVRILSIETGVSAGGRGITSICGAVGDVELAIREAAGQAEARGQLHSDVIIPGLHSDVKGFLSGNR